MANDILVTYNKCYTLTSGHALIAGPCIATLMLSSF